MLVRCAGPLTWPQMTRQLEMFLSTRLEKCDSDEVGADMSMMLCERLVRVPVDVVAWEEFEGRIMWMFLWLAMRMLVEEAKSGRWIPCAGLSVSMVSVSSGCWSTGERDLSGVVAREELPDM